MVGDDLFRWVAGRWRLAGVTVTLAAAVVMGWGLRKHYGEGRGYPVEDYVAAVRFLRANVAPGEVVLVHPSAREGFRLYTDMENWHPAVIYGDTGWPCCPRGHAAKPQSSTELAVRQDLDAKIREAGHLWLLHATRGQHWEYAGLNEGELWRSLLTKRGCQPGKGANPANLVVLEMTCPANSP